MPLAEVQRALANLYTDEKSRDRLRIDPVAFASAFGLGPAELAQVSSMSGARLRAYTDSLDRKRVKACAAMLPLFARCLGPRFRAEFVRFARRVPLGEGPQRYRADALAFAAHVRRLRSNGTIGAPERALLAFELQRGAIAFYRYDVIELSGRVARGMTIADTAARATLVAQREFAVRLGRAAVRRNVR